MLLYTAWHSQCGTTVPQISPWTCVATNVNTNLQMHCSSWAARPAAKQAGWQHPPEDTNGDHLSHTHTDKPHRLGCYRRYCYWNPTRLQEQNCCLPAMLLQLRQEKKKRCTVWAMAPFP